MNILLIASFAESLTGFRKPLIQALLAKGYTVHVAAPELRFNTKVHAELEGLGVVSHDIPMQRAGMNPVADLRSLLSLWKLMRMVKPQYVLGYTIKPVIYGTLAAWLARVPRRFALITGLGFAFVDESGAKRGKVRALVQSMYGFALKHSHAVFFQNPDDEALFKELKIITPTTTSYVVNGSGVDVAQFDVAPLPAQSTTHFLLIGRLLGDKGVREYVQAAQKIKQKHPNTQFDLVGWIDENPNAITQSELDEWIAAGTINFLGRLSDVRPAIGDCSVYVLPSYREGTPRTSLEAINSLTRHPC